MDPGDGFAMDNGHQQKKFIRSERGIRTPRPPPPPGSATVGQLINVYANEEINKGRSLYRDYSNTFCVCFADLPKKEIPLTSEQELALLTDYVSFLEN